jgi:hypothetical protein
VSSCWEDCGGFAAKFPGSSYHALLPTARDEVRNKTLRNNSISVICSAVLGRINSIDAAEYGLNETLMSETPIGSQLRFRNQIGCSRDGGKQLIAVTGGSLHPGTSHQLPRKIEKDERSSIICPATEMPQSGLMRRRIRAGKTLKTVKGSYSKVAFSER